MASERQNMSEQEISIKAREHELYVPDTDTNAKPVKPFAVYLRETPAEPLSATTKAILWMVGTVVGSPFSGRLLAGCHAPRTGVTGQKDSTRGEDGDAGIPDSWRRFRHHGRRRFAAEPSAPAP